MWPEQYLCMKLLYQFWVRSSQPNLLFNTNLFNCQFDATLYSCDTGFMTKWLNPHEICTKEPSIRWLSHMIMILMLTTLMVVFCVVSSCVVFILLFAGIRAFVNWFVTHWAKINLQFASFHKKIRRNICGRTGRYKKINFKKMSKKCQDMLA